MTLINPGAANVKALSALHQPYNVMRKGSKQWRKVGKFWWKKTDFYGRKQILAEENKLWRKKTNCGMKKTICGRKKTNCGRKKTIGGRGSCPPSVLICTHPSISWLIWHGTTSVPWYRWMAWYQRMVPAYHGTRVSWYCWHGTSVQGVVGPGLSQREVHSQIFHPVLQIDNGRPENGVKVFNHAISLREIT